MIKTRNSKSRRAHEQIVDLIRKKYQTGERFMSVRALARHEHLSPCTAQRIISRLKREGVLKQRGKRIGTIAKIPACIPPYHIAFLVPQTPAWFAERFVEGLLSGFSGKVPLENLHVFDSGEMLPVETAEQLMVEGLDGVIGTARDYGWPFFALHQLGLRILADLPSAHWQGMPVTSVDFSSTTREAATLLNDFGHRRVCVVGLTIARPEPRIFKKVFQGDFVGHVQDLYAEQGVAEFRSILHSEKPTALYVADRGYIPIVLSILSELDKSVPDDFSVVIHDLNAEPYANFSVPPLTSVGPSLQTIGKNLA